MIPGCPIFVYQMGRVASTAIVRSLEARGVAAHHGHFLDPLWHQSKPVDNFSEAVETAHKAWLRYYLLDQGAAGVFRIISPFREPVGWLVSERYQSKQRPLSLDEFNAELDINQFRREVDIMCRRAVLHKDASIDALLRKSKQGNREEIFDAVTPRLPVEWFDRELKCYAGVDVYAAPFGEGREYQMFGNVLAIKQESLGQNAIQAIGRFAQLPDFELIRTNEGATGRYGGSYQAAVEACKFPTEFLDMQYGSTYVRHFYSDAEIQGFYRKWQA
jgi:hypothetical protein